ncbi:MAG: alanine racemase, partial [Gammaproteobacteria bacterium]|nr:alanine racemase [Gammaproteobacteria bacterium]
ATALNIDIAVLIDIDMGRHRSGVTSITQATELARVIHTTSSLRLEGVQAYAGHLSHCWDYLQRLEQSQQSALRLQQFLDKLCAWMVTEKPIVTGGSTGGFIVETAHQLYTEMQCGSYPLMDTEYLAVDLDGKQTKLFPPSLRVATAVISNNTPQLATTDGGDKSMISKYQLAPIITAGAPLDATYIIKSDEHGEIRLPNTQVLANGTLVEVIPPHCDPTINLYDQFYVVDEERVIDIWAIDSRGVVAK